MLHLHLRLLLLHHGRGLRGHAGQHCMHVHLLLLRGLQRVQTRVRPTTLQVQAAGQG
jgi:hypothetical protein